VYVYVCVFVLNWKATHPQTQVLAQPVNNKGVPPYDFVDETYVPKDIVTGITIKGKSLAFPLSLMTYNPLILFNFENTDLIIGYAGNATHIYQNLAQRHYEYVTGGYIKDAMNITYNLIDGLALNGSNYASLHKIEAQSMYRFAWDNFFPNSTVFSYDDIPPSAESDSTPDTTTSSPNSVPPFFIESVMSSLVLLYLIKRRKRQ